MFRPPHLSPASVGLHAVCRLERTESRLQCDLEAGLQLSKVSALLLAQKSKEEGLQSSSALNQVNDQDDDGNDEQEMDQTTANVAEEAKKPEHDQDDNYSPEHGYSFRLS
jgi:hypothetical protein